MKTLTCKQLGGPCDTPIQGSTPEEIMQKGGEHLNEMTAKGDESHKAAKEMMDSAANNPEEMKKWMDQFTATYNSAAEE